MAGLTLDLFAEAFEQLIDTLTDKSRTKANPQSASLGRKRAEEVTAPLCGERLTELVSLLRQAFAEDLLRANDCAESYAVERATGIPASNGYQRAPKSAVSSAKKRGSIQLDSTGAEQAKKLKATNISKRAKKSAVSSAKKQATFQTASCGSERQLKAQIASMSLEELTKAIRLARDKAYEEQALTPLEEYLFNKFLNLSATKTIEDLARRLKE